MIVDDKGARLFKERGFIYRLQTSRFLPKPLYEKIANLSLSKKIYLIIFISAVPILILTLISIFLLGIRIESNISQKMESSGKAAANTVNYFKEQTHVMSKMIADDQIVRRGLEFSKEQYKIRELVQTKMPELKVDLIYIHDKNMKMIAQGEYPSKFNIYNENNKYWKDVLDDALVGQRNYVIRLEKLSSNEEQNFIMKTTVPIFHETEKSHLLGYCTVGYKLDNEFARRVQKIIGVDVILTHDTKLYASSFYNPSKIEKNNLLDQEKADYEFESSNTDMMVLGKTYDRRFIPIVPPEMSEEDTTSYAKLWILVDNSQIWSSFYWTIFAITLLSLIIISIALLVAFKIAYNILDSTDKIFQGTQHIANRNFSYQINLRTSDELAHLAKTFNEMTGVIKDYSENLEQKVTERTLALMDANTKLEDTNNELEEINLEITKELQMAKSLQDSLLPRDIPKFKNVSIGTIYVSMGTVGGDYYDIFYINDDEIGVLMSDASGHGVPAALITTMAKVSFTSHSVGKEAPGEVCTLVNEDMYKSIGELDNYITAFYSIFNTKTRELKYTNAGHQKAIYYNSIEGKIDELDTNGFFIGAIEEALYESKQIKVNPGDKIVLFTDGIVEARNEENEFYGNERLYDFVLNNGEISTEEFIDELMTSLNRFCGTREQDDDISLLVISIVEDESVLMSEDERKKAILREREDFTRLIYDFETGVSYLKDGNEDKAIEIFEYIIEKNPENTQALYNLGVIYYKREDYRKAREYWEEILKYRPGSSKVITSLKKVDNLIRGLTTDTKLK